MRSGLHRDELELKVVCSRGVSKFTKKNVGMKTLIEDNVGVGFRG